MTPSPEWEQPQPGRSGGLFLGRLDPALDSCRRYRLRSAELSSQVVRIGRGKISKARDASASQLHRRGGPHPLDRCQVIGSESNAAKTGSSGRSSGAVLSISEHSFSSRRSAESPGAIRAARVNCSVKGCSEVLA